MSGNDTYNLLNCPGQLKTLLFNLLWVKDQAWKLCKLCFSSHDWWYVYVAKACAPMNEGIFVALVFFMNIFPSRAWHLWDVKPPPLLLSATLHSALFLLFLLFLHPSLPSPHLSTLVATALISKNLTRAHLPRQKLTFMSSSISWLQKKRKKTGFPCSLYITLWVLSSSSYIW